MAGTVGAPDEAAPADEDERGTDRAARCHARDRRGGGRRLIYLQAVPVEDCPGLKRGQSLKRAPMSKRFAWLAVRLSVKQLIPKGDARWHRFTRSGRSRRRRRRSGRRCATGALCTSGLCLASRWTRSLDGEDRIVTFFNGAVARERLVDLSEEDRRLAWSIVDGPYSHHNGVAQAVANDDGTTRFVWVADLLPDELAEITAGLMERGIETVKKTLEAVQPDGA